MHTINENATDPKDPKDSFSGIENDNQVTNSQEQNVVEDEVVDKSDSEEKKDADAGSGLSEKERVDTANTN